MLIAIFFFTTVENLHTLKEDDLVDMLSEYTAKYLRMISEGTSFEEIKKHREVLDEIIKEIGKRRKGENMTEMYR